MDNSLIVIACLLALGAVLYGVYKWGQKTGAPATVVKASADIREAETVVEQKVETAATAVEDDAWKLLEAALSKAVDLSAAKAKADSASADYAAAQKRVAEFKASVAALPNA